MDLSQHNSNEDSAETLSLFSHVLLIEDDPAHARLIERALDGIVGEIDTVSSGQAAIEALETSLPELVFCDLHLPDVSGLELLAAVRSARPGLPVIVMTSSHNLDDAVAAMRVGAWDYMVKQFSENLVERIKFVVGRVAQRKLHQIREYQVRAERDAFWAAVHTAPDGVTMLSANGTVVFANEMFKGFCYLATQSSIPVLGLNLIDTICAHDPAVAEGLRTQLQSLKQKNEGVNLLWASELKLKPAQGDEKNSRYFELALTSVQFGSEPPQMQLPDDFAWERQRHVIWVHDITRRKEQEKFQRDLLSTTTHDLKGPLGAILNAAELLGEKYLRGNQPAQDLLNRLASCARNSVNLIDELLSARRIQDGVLIVQPRWHDLAEILDDLFLDFLPMANVKKLVFHCNPLQDGLQVFADKIGLTRVLNNLISNAIKFTPLNGKVEISGERSSNEVRISVSDTGPGIESTASRLIFERYGRLEKHQEIEGTGLGLFVTKNIVDAHGGRIEVISKVGVGTTMIIILPDEA